MPESNEPHGYDAAMAAAEGDPVHEIAAAKVTPNMLLFHEDRYLLVKYANQLDRSVMIDYYAEQGMTACRVVAPTTTMYRRIPTHHPVRVGTTE